jgi:hypothetical protein
MEFLRLVEAMAAILSPDLLVSAVVVKGLRWSSCEPLSAGPEAVSMAGAGGRW